MGWLELARIFGLAALALLGVFLFVWVLDFFGDVLDLLP